MSSSSSNTSQPISTTDNRRVIGQNGISNENGVVMINTTNNTLDADVVNQAMSAIKGATGQAFDFGGQTVTAALGFGGNALQAALNAQSDALAFADSNAKLNAKLAYDSLGASLASSDTSLSKAFAFGTNALNQSFGTLADTENLVANAYADAKGRGALTDKILIGAIAAMALVAFAAVQK